MEEIDRRFWNEMRAKGVDESKIYRMAPLNDGYVKMANLAVIGSHNVNGVSALHGDILKNSLFADVYSFEPEKFTYVTNGIDHRRWLSQINPKLDSLVRELIGPGYLKKPEELIGLRRFENDAEVLMRLQEIKGFNKAALAEYMKKTQGFELNTDAVLDVQVKRLHEYKRQHMNALNILATYQWLRENPNADFVPHTYFFGAKAAPAYTIAKDIIHLILCLQQLFAEDPQVAPYLKIVMVENYNVSWAEKLIPACDVSEQISLASKEASGTGNMKLMLNGAVTLGTMDGANVEIAQLVEKENCYIFGKSSDEVMKLYETKGYSSRRIYEQDPIIERLVDFIISKEMIKRGDPLPLCRLYKEIINKDWFMTLLDLKEYIQVKEQMFLDFEDRMAWSRKMLYNIAQAGYFSSDRTIKGYCQDIWKL